MAMNVGSGNSSGDPEVMIDINTTPLIDVMLVLIIMLIITIPIQLHSVSLNMPTGTPPPPSGAAGGRHDRHRLRRHRALERRGLADRRALEVKLQQAAATPDQPEVHIRPNRLVEYKSVAMVLASAQRLGVTKLGMIGNEQFVK
jgi:biopolymer transport protein ExbD